MDEVCKACGRTENVLFVPIDGEIGCSQVILPFGILVEGVGLPLCKACRSHINVAIGNVLQERKAEAATDLEITRQPDGINPTWERNEIPLCGEGACRFYVDLECGRHDAAFCKATGGKALCEDGHCEPAIQRMARALRPFADYASVDSVTLNKATADDFLIARRSKRLQSGEILETSITTGHFRAAAESLPKGVA